MTRMRRSAAVATLAILALGVASCSSAEPSPSSTSAGSTSSNSSPSPSSSTWTNPDVETGTANPVPAEAREKTKSGALAFTRFYLHQMGEAIKTRESATLRQYSLECQQCDEFIRWIDSGQKRGMSADSNPYVVHEATVLSSVPSAYEIRARLEVQGIHNIHPDGSKGSATDPRVYSTVLSVAWVGGGWKVRGMSRV